jgi:esterase/lipase
MLVKFIKLNWEEGLQIRQGFCGIDQLGNRLELIKARTLVIRGEKDRIMEVSAARIIKKN